MIKRISEDKEKLRSTVRSLEKANFDLKQAQKEIIRAEKLASVGRLSAGIAHEIGNPMGIIIGYLDLLKQKDIEDKEKIDFTEPIFTMTLKGTQLYKISLFNKNNEDDMNYPAISSENDYPFHLSKYDAEKFMKEPNDLLKE